MAVYMAKIPLGRTTKYASSPGHAHELYTKDDGLTELQFILVVNGGLRICKHCGGAEASLTSHCVQKLVGYHTLNAVAQGRIDFYDGTWHPVAL